MELTPSVPGPVYLTTRQVAQRYPLAEATLRYYRSKGIGPKSFKVGRKVLYCEHEVEAWMAAQVEATTRGGENAA